MKLGFDSKKLFYNSTGLGNYSRSLLRNLQRCYPENQYHLYTPKIRNTPESDHFSNNASFRIHPAKSVFKAFWRSFGIVKQLEKDEIELYHGLSNEIPFSIRKSKVKSIVTIHDLIFKILPATYPLVDRTIYDIKFRFSCLFADKIIAISESTKKDIVRLYGTDPDKIEVIYQHCDLLYYKSTPDLQEDSKLQELNIPNDYILYVGSIEKRKNIYGIIEAYRYLDKDLRIPLVIVGGYKDAGYKRDLNELIKANDLEKMVIWKTELKNNHDLKCIYQKAKAMVYPSFYEGFGLPVIEALLSKTPVITSNVSSLPEAGGPNSLYIDPSNPKEIAQAITQVLSNSQIRDSMIERGYEYAIRKFSPDHVTKQLMACYENTLQQKE